MCFSPIGKVFKLKKCKSVVAFLSLCSTPYCGFMKRIKLWYGYNPKWSEVSKVSLKSQNTNNFKPTFFRWRSNIFRLKNWSARISHNFSIMWGLWADWSRVCNPWLARISYYQKTNNWFKIHWKSLLCSRDYQCFESGDCRRSGWCFNHWYR